MAFLGTTPDFRRPAFTSRFSGPTRAIRRSFVASLTAYYGQHATPASEAQQSFLTSYLRQDPDELRWARVFESFEETLCSHEHPHRVGPVTD
jgi:hypothetical protein